MTGVAAWALDALVASTLLMALVLLVRHPVRRAFGPRIAYALWLLPALRVVLPPLPAAWHGESPAPLARAGETLILIVSSPPTTADAASGVPSLGMLLAAVWAIGAATFLAYHLARHHRFCRHILRDAVIAERVGGIEVVLSGAATGPMAFGIWRRVVILPSDASVRYDPTEYALALAHEVSHHRRRDLVANGAALGLLALHWFDPLAWHAFRAFRIDQEMANDAAVLAGRSSAERRSYAAAILKTVAGTTMPAACHLHTVADLKGRLKMLATSPASRRRLAAGGVSLAAFFAAGLALTASQTGAAALRRQVSERVAPAVPPAAPSSPAAPAAPAHRISKVIVTKDGRTTVHDDLDSAAIDRGLAAGQRIAIQPAVPGGSRMIVKMPDDPAALVEVQDIPAVREAKCGIGTGKPASMVVQNGHGPKRLIVICTDRIAKVTSDAVATAASSKGMVHDAYVHALDGLTTARAHVAGDTGMSDADRTRALSAIDMSITEMKGQLARQD